MKRALLIILSLIAISTISFAGDLSLKTSLDTALEKSPSIISAREGVVAADGKLGQAFGALLPNLSVSGQYGQTYTKPYKFAGIVSVGTEEASITSGYTLTLTQPLFNTALFPGLQIAEAGYRIAKETYNKARNQLQYDVVNTYYGVLKSEKMYQLSKDILDMSNSHLKQASAMLEAGTATRADVLRVEVEVANNEANLTKAESGMVLAKDAFNNILGRDLETEISLSEKEIATEIVSPEPKRTCLDAALKNSPDWIIFQMNKQINGKSKDVAYSGYFPSISLIGTVQSNKNEFDKNDVFNTEINTNTIVASAQWDIFDGLAREGRIKEAGANIAALEANEESIRNGIVLSVKDACMNLESAVKVIRSSKKAVDLARENYRIARERYRTGAGSNLEMIDAETAYSRASTDLYQAQFDYQIAKAKVNQVVGQDVYPFDGKEKDK